MPPNVSFVVVTWESEKDLESLISSMNSFLPDPGRIELIVVDNASTRDPGETARSWKGPVEIDRLESNLGFGAASNRGVAKAHSPVTVLCNPDIRLIDDSILDLCELAMERNALAGPRLLWPDGSDQPSASGPVTGLWPWIGAVVPGAVQPEPMLRKTEAWRCSETVPVEWLTGALVAGPTELLRALGPFDERIELMAEDLDLCLRAGDRGITCLFAPEVATAIHTGGTSRERRFDDGGLALAARNRDEVIARSRGTGAARRARSAQSLRLRLRIVAKSLLKADAARERAELEAMESSSGIPHPG